MKRLTLLAAALLAGCSTTPQVIPDNTTDSVVMMKLKHEITSGDQISQNWGWILWYLPIVFLVVAWAWKELIAKRKDDDDDNDATPAPQPAPQDSTTTVP